MSVIFRTVLPGLAVLLLLAAPALHAEQKNPDQVIRQAMKNITERVEKERKKVENDDGYARKVVEEELGDLVDFRRVTRAVMGEHFGQASREQRNEFMETFRKSLLDTYASGIALYEGQRWDVPSLDDGDIRGNRARVRMNFRTGDGNVVSVVYSMIDNNGDWQVENVIVNNLNLGQVFRSQFAQSVREHGGDLDKVISNWAGDMEDEDPLEDGEA